MLRNPIYRGERIWNRSFWVKDHETGKRKRFERPENEWVKQHEESWRIVSDGLWQAAQVPGASATSGTYATAKGALFAPR